MWVERIRTKKLIAAFHFQFANQAAWKCEVCRSSGLEGKRRCGWIVESIIERPSIVWARKTVGVTSCPTSYITPESMALLEEFHAWKLFGTAEWRELPARLVEAFFVLENEQRSERNDAQI